MISEDHHLELLDCTTKAFSLADGCFGERSQMVTIVRRFLLFAMTLVRIESLC